MLIICDRKIKIATGAKTQTVNICTINNLFGEYEYIIRISPPHPSLESDLNSRRFSSLEELVEHVCDHYPGVVEKRSKRPMVGQTRKISCNDQSQPSTFNEWYDQWKHLMEFSGAHMSDPQGRINQVLNLWNAPVPNGWQRGHDSQLMGDRYRRGDFNNPHPGEHTIEHDILKKHFDRINFLGYKLIDGINAMPLTQDAEGGRRANVEADLFVLLQKDSQFVMAICEVKSKANNPWFALVENIRQLKLLQLSATARELFHRRNSSLALPLEIPIMSCVIAPKDFYTYPGQKSNAYPHAEQLIKRFCTMSELIVCLATWNLQEQQVVACHPRVCPR